MCSATLKRPSLGSTSLTKILSARLVVFSVLFYVLDPG